MVHPSKKSESNIRMTFSCKAPSRLLATSEHSAVMVHENATTSEMVSPKYNIVWLNIKYPRQSTGISNYILFYLNNQILTGTPELVRIGDIQGQLTFLILYQ